MKRLLLLLVALSGCTEVNSGTLCTSGDELWAVFNSCRSSANTVHVASCEISGDDNTLRAATRYRETGNSGEPDCQFEYATCDLPAGTDLASATVVKGSGDPQAIADLRACSDFAP